MVKFNANEYKSLKGFEAIVYLIKSSLFMSAFLPSALSLICVFIVASNPVGGVLISIIAIPLVGFVTIIVTLSTALREHEPYDVHENKRSSGNQNVRSTAQIQNTNGQKFRTQEDIENGGVEHDLNAALTPQSKRTFVNVNIGHNVTNTNSGQDVKQEQRRQNEAIRSLNSQGAAIGRRSNIINPFSFAQPGTLPFTIANANPTLPVGEVSRVMDEINNQSDKANIVYDICYTFLSTYFEVYVSMIGESVAELVNVITTLSSQTHPLDVLSSTTLLTEKTEQYRQILRNSFRIYKVKSDWKLNFADIPEHLISDNMWSTQELISMHISQLVGISDINSLIELSLKESVELANALGELPPVFSSNLNSKVIELWNRIMPITLHNFNSASKLYKMCQLANVEFPYSPYIPQGQESLLENIKNSKVTLTQLENLLAADVNAISPDYYIQSRYCKISSKLKISVLQDFYNQLLDLLDGNRWSNELEESLEILCSDFSKSLVYKGDSKEIENLNVGVLLNILSILLNKSHPVRNRQTDNYKASLSGVRSDLLFVFMTFKASQVTEGCYEALGDKTYLQAQMQA